MSAIGQPTCWSCGAQVASQFCAACGKVQPPASPDYFSFFSLPRKLQINTAALEKEFYRLSRKLHPDVYARASAREQEWSLEQTSRLNDAYRTLRDPIARTEYLLGLEGYKLEEQSKAATDAARASGGEKKQVVPPDLLEEVFELNMQLEEMRAAKKMGEAADEQVTRDLQAAQRNFEQRLRAMQQQLEQHWRDWDALAPDAPAEERQRVLRGMLDLLNRRSYIRNLVRDVNEALAA
jgi:molecular chaperone HscB